VWNEVLDAKLWLFGTDEVVGKELSMMFLGRLQMKCFIPNRQYGAICFMFGVG
jgi:hypothetical protein